MRRVVLVLFILLACNLVADTIMFFDFDNEFDFFFDDWTQHRVQGMTSWCLAQGGYNDHPPYAHSGNRNAFFFRDVGETGTQITQLITPAMDVRNYTYVTLSMWFGGEAWFNDMDWMYVYYRESEEDDWHYFWYPDSDSNWIYREHVIGTFPEADSFQIMFEGYADGGFGLCVDDVHVFGTPIGPGMAIDPLPLRSATGVSQDTGISWTNTGLTTEVEVRFDTVNPPQNVIYSGTTIDTLTSAQIGGPFDLGTIIYWQVNSINDTLQTNGMVWSFTVVEPPPGYLETSPDTIACTLAQGLQDECSLNLSNTGGQSLDYELVVMGTSSRALLTEDFESGVFPPDGWQTYRLGATDDRGWIESTYQYHSSSHSCVHPDDDYNSMAHDWIVTPAVQIGSDSQLQFYERNQYVYGNYYTYHGVWISTGSGDPADGDFVELMEFGNGAEDWVLRTIDLSEYMGETAYFGFYYQGDYDSLWRIDDVTVTGEPLPDWLTVEGSQSLSGTIPPGITESLAVELDATGMDIGTYGASLLITPANDQGTILKPVIMTVIELQLIPPDDVLIVTGTNSVTLSWNPVNGATSYRVYSSTDPESGWDVDETGVLNGTTWNAPVTAGKMFYRVTCLIE